MDKYQNTIEALKSNPKSWLITGVAGFIGSNIAEVLLENNQKVIGLDDFSTGFQHNLDEVKETVKENWQNFHFKEGSICDFDLCRELCEDVDIVLHQGALGSVPRSIENPIASNRVNVDGTLNIFKAAAEAGVKRVVYASSSSVYGDDKSSPKTEEFTGTPLSPYAVTKKTNELYAHVFQQHYGVETIGLRYFNVFGKRQNPDGAYAAVIPKWIQALIKKEHLFINGDGSTSRDFTYIQNIVELNILAATTTQEIPLGTVLNGALADTTNLIRLFEILKKVLQYHFKYIENVSPEYKKFREGDIKHSFANINKAVNLLGYNPKIKIEEGLKLTVDWYIKNLLK
jgi:UDP-N-acetylglucosamine 4-epimerase